MATAEPTRADHTEGGGRMSPEPGTDVTGTAGRTLSPDRADADTPPAWRRWPREHPVLFITALAAVLHVIWFFTSANSGGDLAAQDAWAEFVGRHPDSAYNLAWYGGMHPVSYSVLSPYLMSVLGVRTTMMIAGTFSAGLLTLILVRGRAVREPLWPALAGVFALMGNAASGRVTFGLGTMFALGAVAAVFCWPYQGRYASWAKALAAAPLALLAGVFALLAGAVSGWVAYGLAALFGIGAVAVLLYWPYEGRYKRWAKALAAAPLAALATMSSPVAGLFVGLVAVALFLQKRRPGAWALGLAPAAVVALSAWLFPFSGTQPMTFGSVIMPLLYGLLCLALVPRQWVTVRLTAGVYSVAVVLVWLISSQIGTNISRLPMLFAGTALVAALPFAVPRTHKWYALVLAIAGFVGWIGFKSVDDVIHTTPAASWARELAPLVNELQQVGAEKGRVEVVPARSHREASALAPYVNLARGWNRQADMERNPLFYDDTLNSANYHEWLQRWAVHYVVLPKADDPDGDGGERERELVLRGMPYLKQVWGNADWQLFRVTDPVPLAEPNAVVLRAEQGEMTLKVSRAGRVLIRIPYSPWLSVVDEHGKPLKPPQETEASKERADGVPKTYVNVSGCLAETPQDAEGDAWTVLLAPRAGTYHLAAPYQLPRGTPCPQELKDAKG
ncbi:MFS transporter [Streptomyces sp. DSM 110735]|uniref:MFS transporter n=1 Tax=Streptomyces sp. DSM 110735 TaxID=2775031 RepID=UPI0018F4A2D2|nr:MFS transporter [Streptomyces sp. DSM 110735]